MPYGHARFFCLFHLPTEKQGQQIPECQDILESGSGSGSGELIDLGLQTDDEDYIVFEGRRCHTRDTRCLIEVGLILCSGYYRREPPSDVIITSGFKSSLHNPAVIATIVLACAMIILSVTLIIVVFVQWQRVKVHRNSLRNGTVTRYIKPAAAGGPGMRIVNLA